MAEDKHHTLEFLLTFDGHINWYAEGYFTKFEIKRVAPTAERPHGLRYSLTLHAPESTRLMGFDNAHTVAGVGSRFAKRQAAADHWHRTEDDEGRPYVFTDAATLIFDFFAEVERTLKERGVPTDVMRIEQTSKRKTR
jgi:Family of unknown function (DUF6516)